MAEKTKNEVAFVKKKVKFTLKQVLKTQRRSRSIVLLFVLNGVVDGGGWSAPRPGRFTPQKRPGTHCTGGWVGPRAGVDGCGKSRPPPVFDPRTVHPVASRYTD